MSIAPTIRAELAPTGKLRAGINYSNFVLAKRDPVSGEPRGIAADLAREIAKRLEIPIEFITFKNAGRMADAVKSGAWDIGFLANEPERAHEILFTPAYLEIEAGYVVPAGSPIRSIAEIDRHGVRVAVGNKSAYDLFLSRTLERATVIRAPGMDASYDVFVAEKLNALAGIKPWLVTAAERLSGSRLLDGYFMTVQQSIGLPRGREAAAGYLCEFVQDVKASGFLNGAIQELNLPGISVPIA
jgi:polar amino acid transport system substrate-binding protein